MIYLDNAATTGVCSAVFAKMFPYFLTHFGNPESVHAAAEMPKKAIEEAERRVHELLHTGGHGKVVFTSGGTESNNMAFKICQSPKQLALNIITSATEHKSVLEPAKACDRATLRTIKPGAKGYIALTDLPLETIPAYTLVSMMHMNNETGTINEVYEIGKRLKLLSDLDVFFHVDCVQSAGELPIHAIDMNADMISVSSHKIHGPKGVGCLWVSDRLVERLGDGKNLSLILGGGQQAGFRAGTMDVPSIVGFGEACRIANEVCEANRNTVFASANIFMDRLIGLCRQKKIKLKLNFNDVEHHDAKILSISFPGADAETVVLLASEKGLCISSGAACNSVSSEPSYVLTNSGISPVRARSTVRISFSSVNDVCDAQDGAEILAEAVEETLAMNLTAAVQ